MPEMYNLLKKCEIDLVGIYTGFILNYGDLHIKENTKDNFCTLKEINYFAKLGSMLGYLPCTEDMRYETMKLMDLSWKQTLTKDKPLTLILHMERENNPNKAEETIDKLLPGYKPGSYFEEEYKDRYFYVIGIQRLKTGDQVEGLKNKILGLAREREKGLFVFYYIDENKREIADGYLLSGKTLTQLDTAVFDCQNRERFWRASFENKYI